MRFTEINGWTITYPNPRIANGTHAVWFGGYFILETALTTGTNRYIIGPINTNGSGNDASFYLILNYNAGANRLELRDLALGVVATGSNITADINTVYRWWMKFDGTNITVYLNGASDMTVAKTAMPLASASNNQMALGVGVTLGAGILLQRDVFRVTSDANDFNMATDVPETKGLPPDGAGNYTDWTGTEADWDDYDGAETPDDDTTYIEKLNVAGTFRESVLLLDPSLVNATLVGIVARGWNRQDDATKNTIMRHFIREGSTDSANTDAVSHTGTTYISSQSVWNVRAGGGAWTEAGLIATELGVQRVNDSTAGIRVSAALVEYLSFGATLDYTIAAATGDRRRLLAA
jgi:hypothetical protein